MIHRVTCDLRQLPITPAKSAIPTSGCLAVLFTPVIKLFDKGRVDGRGKTDRVIPTSEGTGGDIFGTVERYERWGPLQVEAFCVGCWNLSVTEKWVWSRLQRSLSGVQSQTRGPGRECCVRIHDWGHFAKKERLQVASKPPVKDPWRAFQQLLDVFK